MSLLSLVAVAVVLTLLGSVGLIIWSLRGKKIDDHPLCRKCGFDLTGKPETSRQCPECGADLAGPRAILHGHRRRRTGWMVASLVTFLLVSSVGITLSVASIRKTDLNPYKPLFVLRWELASSDRLRSHPSVSELNRRIKAGLLTAADAQSLSDRILALQADATFAWDDRLGQLFCDLRKARQVDDARWVRYARQSLVPSTQARRVALDSARIPASLAVRSRAAAPSWNPLSYHITTSTALDAPPGEAKDELLMSSVVEIPEPTVTVPIFVASPRSGEDPSPEPSTRASGGGGSGAVGGERDLFVRVRVEVYESAVGFGAIRPPPASARLLTSFDVVQSHRVALRPDLMAICPPVSDPALTPRVQSSIRVHSVTRWSQRVSGGDAHGVNIRLVAANSPTDLSFTPSLERQGKPIIASRQNATLLNTFICVPKGGGSSVVDLSFLMLPGEPEELDLLLYPSQTGAIESLNLNSYFDVPIKLRISAPRPPPPTPARPPTTRH